jgi:hypothetical protein
MILPLQRLHNNEGITLKLTGINSMIFELPLTEERVKPHQVTALHLFVVFTMFITAAVLLVSYYAVSHMPEDKALSHRTVLYYGLAAGMGMMLISILMLVIILVKNKWLQKPLNNLTMRGAELLLMLVFAGFALAYGITVPGIVFLVLAGAIVFAINWERKIGTPLTIVVNKEGIRPPVSTRKRFIEWPEVEHVLLRFGTLTVNCTDNRLYQWNISTTDFEPEVFEVFCIRQVDKAREQRAKNDW